MVFDIVLNIIRTGFSSHKHMWFTKIGWISRDLSPNEHTLDTHTQLLPLNQWRIYTWRPEKYVRIQGSWLKCQTFINRPPCWQLDNQPHYFIHIQEDSSYASFETHNSMLKHMVFGIALKMIKSGHNSQMFVVRYHLMNIKSMSHIPFPAGNWCLPFSSDINYYLNEERNWSCEAWVMAHLYYSGINHPVVMCIHLTNRLGGKYRPQLYGTKRPNPRFSFWMLFWQNTFQHCFNCKIYLSKDLTKVIFNKMVW